MAFLLFGNLLAAQEASSTKPTEHFLGTISVIDPVAHSITLKDDKTSIEQVILLADTKTLIKVAPGATDLKSAKRITADELAVGDRVDVRGFKAVGDPAKVAARSVVLMSARDLQQAHEAQAAEWQHSTAGVVSGIDTASGKITINTRTPEGPKPVAIEASSKAEFTRYSPENPGRLLPSQISEIQAGDQVRVLGDKSEDGSTIVARKIYSGAFKTLNGTVLSVGADGKSLTIKDLASKKPLEILVSDNTSVRKLPPELALRIARRANPAARPSGGTDASATPDKGSGTGRPSATGTDSAAPPPENGGPERDGAQPRNPGFAPRGPRNGDISQMIERLPSFSLTDLKPGDALVISGVTSGSDKSRLSATNIIAGVEPILQAAPSRQGQATGGDWGLGEISAPQ